MEEDQTKVANHFANFSYTMADGVRSDHVNELFEFKEITCEELRKVMNGLNPNK